MATERARAALHGVCPHMTGRAEERVAQSNIACAGLLATVNQSYSVNSYSFGAKLTHFWRCLFLLCSLLVLFFAFLFFPSISLVLLLLFPSLWMCPCCDHSGWISETSSCEHSNNSKGNIGWQVAVRWTLNQQPYEVHSSTMNSQTWLVYFHLSGK